MGFPFKTLIWRQTKIPVIIGNKRIFLKITLNDTCSLLTPDILHTDVTALAITRRKALYKAHFLDQLESLCSVDQGQNLIDETGQLTVRNRRELENTTANTLILEAEPENSSLLQSSLFLRYYGLHLEFHSHYLLLTVTIESMKDVPDTQGKQIEILEERINITQIAVQSLQKDLNSLVTEFESHIGESF